MTHQCREHWAHRIIICMPILNILSLFLYSTMGIWPRFANHRCCLQMVREDVNPRNKLLMHKLVFVTATLHEQYMVTVVTSTYAISVYIPLRWKLDSKTWRGVLDTTLLYYSLSVIIDRLVMFSMSSCFFHQQN